MAAYSRVKCFNKCRSFNVALIGDSRVGKSTFIQLLQEDTVSTVFDLYRGTVLPEVKTLYINNEGTSFPTHVVLNILDTPGLDEKPAEGTARPNEELKFMISEHIKSNFSDLDLILITIKCGGITDKVVKSIFDVKEYFGNKYLNNMCLLITHCDGMSKELEETFTVDLCSNVVVKRFLEAIHFRVLFTGRNSADAKTTENLDFIQIQKRRQDEFLNLLSTSVRINLKQAADLEDIRPIDILESAAVTNSMILTLSEANKQDRDHVMSLFHKLRGLQLPEEAQAKVNNLIDYIGREVVDRVLAEATQEEKRQAEEYTRAEIPLKQKAASLRTDSFLLKTTLAQVESAYNVYGMQAIVKPPEVVELKKPLVNINDFL